jgi:hypothetical protein
MNFRKIVFEKTQEEATSFLYVAICKSGKVLRGCEFGSDPGKALEMIKYVEYYIKDGNPIAFFSKPNTEGN